MTKKVLMMMVVSLFLGSVSFAEEADLPGHIFPQSAWGQPPAKVTKEMVCADHPELCQTQSDDAQSE